MHKLDFNKFLRRFYLFPIFTLKIFRMIYEGIAMSSRFPSGRKSVKIEIGFSDIIFSFNEEKIKFSISMTEISIGGANNRLIYFNHPGFPDISFYTTDKAILKDPNLHYHDHAKDGVKKVKKQRAINWGIWLGVIGFFVAIILSVFIFRSNIVKGVADQIPPQWEKDMGDKLFEQVKVEYKLVNDTALINELTRTLQPLVNAIEDTAFHFKFYIANNPTLNAFAMPGGNVVIHSGIIEKAANWEELMGVLAHELSHVTQRHHIRGIISNLGIYVVLSSFFGDASALLGTLAQASGSLTSLKTSREYETESDETGWDYLIKANINPEGMIGMFKKLQKEYPQDEDTEELTSLLQTHPAIGERIEVLTAKKKKLKDQHFITFQNSFDTFKKRLKTDLDKQ